MIKTAFVFPGQGAQVVGMGKDFYDSSDTAKRVFDTFDGVVPGLSQICFEGPAEELKKTLYTQPAILATSLAAYELFKEQMSVEPTLVAGHSLGEYGALYASGAFDLQTAAKLIQKRAELMENAPEGSMAVVLGLEAPKVNDIVKKVASVGNNTLTVANYNTEKQLVISGHKEAIEQVMPLLKEAGARRVMPLPVGGAFHSPLMDVAAREFGAFLENIELSGAYPSVITNVDATQTSDSEAIRRKLAQQINHSVLWSQTMTRMVEEHYVDSVIEFGPGKVLTGMFKKEFPEVQVFNVFDMDSLKQVCEQLKAQPVE